MHYNAYSAVRALNALETEGCQIGSLSPAPSPRAKGKLLPRANLTETITPGQSRREAMVVVARPSAPNTSECARGLGLRTRASLVFGRPRAWQPAALFRRIPVVARRHRRYVVGRPSRQLQGAS